MITIYGVPFSAHTRKVILTAKLKKLEFNIEPVVPMAPPEGWEELSPVGKIPALKDGDFVLSDSSVICAYLERKYPQFSIYPDGVESYARALWIEEYIDSDLQQFVLSQFLFETIFAPAFLKRETNWDVVNNALTIEIPKRFAKLEQWVRPDQYLVSNQFSIADITLASILVNFNYGGQRIDENLYPKLAAYFKFILNNEVISAALREEHDAAKTIPGFNFSFLQPIT